MFHNNYRIYQINFNLYNIEIEYFNEYDGKTITKTIDVDKNQLATLVELLDDLGFDDRTPQDN